MKRLKITEIDYRKLPNDMIRIIQVRHAADKKTIIEAFGEEVFYVYIEGYPSYRTLEVKDYYDLLCVNISNTLKPTLRPGKEISYSEFKDIIYAMKVAGSRFMHIVNEIKNKPKKTVRI